VRFLRAVGAAFRFIRDPANRGEVTKAIVELTGSSDEIARQTLALYFEPDRGVIPKQGEDRPERSGAGDFVPGRGRRHQAAAAEP
jgi:hypothetical protein